MAASPITRRPGMLRCPGLFAAPATRERWVYDCRRHESLASSHELLGWRFCTAAVIVPGGFRARNGKGRQVPAHPLRGWLGPQTPTSPLPFVACAARRLPAP